MKISYSWLKQYCPTELKAETVAELLTDCGLEVESTEKFESIKGGLNGLVVGLVKSKEAHPNADRLSITKVDIGAEQELQIVCGASNVAAGQKVIVATIGSTLYPTEGGSFEIKKSKIRGELSEGMICAEDEIGLGNSHEGIMVLNENASIGMPAANYFEMHDDSIFEIGLTPNRADAASHFGVARDLAAVINTHHSKKTKLQLPEITELKADNTHLKIEIRIEDSIACPRYSGISISGIHVKDSPEWLQNRLKSIGLKPINNIVDITNFVLHELGQPLHAFDADKIKGRKIIVKKLTPPVKFITLDGIERNIGAEDLMICNESEPMAIAGVFGGINSGINTETKNIFIESAYFNAPGIRRTSKNHGIKTDASFRYERGADPEITITALKRAVGLILELAGGIISSEITDVYPQKVEWKRVNLTHSYLERISGFKIPSDTIKTILTSLQIEIVSENAESLELRIPPFKSDVEREADIAEEILRVYGLNKIPMPYNMRIPAPASTKPDMEFAKQQISDYLSSNGFFEIMNNSIGKPEADLHIGMNTSQTVKIVNPLSAELGVLRQHMLPAGLENINYNKNRKRNNLKLYEFGKTYHLYPSGYNEKSQLAIFMCGNKNPESWSDKSEEIHFFTIKSVVLNLIEKAGIPARELKFVYDSKESNLYSEGTGIHYMHHHIADFGQIKRSILKQYDIDNHVYFADINWETLIKQASERIVRYKEVPKQPSVRRDLALLLDKKISYAELESTAFQTERHLLKEVTLFDVYEGKNIGTDKKSYALGFILQDTDRTLTDADIDKTMKKLQQAFEKKFGAELRQ